MKSDIKQGASHEDYGDASSASRSGTHILKRPNIAATAVLQRRSYRIDSPTLDTYGASSRPPSKCLRIGQRPSRADKGAGDRPLPRENNEDEEAGRHRVNGKKGPVVIPVGYAEDYRAFGPGKHRARSEPLSDLDLTPRCRCGRSEESHGARGTQGIPHQFGPTRHQKDLSSEAQTKDFSLFSKTPKTLCRTRIGVGGRGTKNPFG